MAPTDHAHQVAAERDNAGTAETADECGEGCCVPATTDARSPCWRHGARRARLLSWLSLIWMSGEGVLGLLAGVRTGSLSLLGWALGSVIEGLASVIVIWRFTGSRTLSDTSEGRAQKAGAVSFFLLAPYLGIQSIRDLLSGHHADISTLGIIVTAASLLVMPALGVAKRRLGAALGSGATTGEGIQNLMCAAQAGAVLLGLAGTAVFGWSWLDLLPSPCCSRDGPSAKAAKPGAAKTAANRTRERCRKWSPRRTTAAVSGRAVGRRVEESSPGRARAAWSP